MEQEYIYAVARIKARELSLLTQQDLDRLMACKTPAECFRALADKGWGAGGETSAEAIFAVGAHARAAARPHAVQRTAVSHRLQQYESGGEVHRHKRGAAQRVYVRRHRGAGKNAAGGQRK